MSLLNAYSLHKYVGYKQEFIKTFLIPLLSSAVMGGAVWGVYQLMIYIFRNNTIATIISILLGALIYFIIMLLLKGITEQELRRLPKGHLLVKAAKSMHLMK